MTSIDIFTQIKSHFNEFTKAEKKVANFILDQPKKVLYMSITDLADECKVGDTSVFRFCKTLKLKGYQDFRVALAQSLTSDAGGVSTLAEEILEQDTLEDVARKVLMTNINALEQTYQLINKKDLEAAVEWFAQAKRILFFGVGASLVTALEARNKFIRITSNVECITDSHIQAMSASLMTPDDVAFVISYSGSTKDIIDIAKIAKNTGAKVICMTRFVKSPLTSYSDLTLLCGANEGPLQGGSLSAKLAQLYLLDVIYTEYFKRTIDTSKRNKEITSASVLEKLY
ncbi:MAG: MurR/RpiR family transcriptional regulator [Clostridia bacterium]|jgi:DNA-binding MurR/RpiR family transcriptional regulator|nr:MurR/RpiR family transcriptional regulator [Clostridia bacterium]